MQQQLLAELSNAWSRKWFTGTYTVRAGIYCTCTIASMDPRRAYEYMPTVLGSFADGTPNQGRVTLPGGQCSLSCTHSAELIQ